jgi:hypothetical protein
MDLTAQHQRPSVCSGYAAEMMNAQPGRVINRRWEQQQKKVKKKAKKVETSSSNPPSARLFMSIRVAAIVGHVSRVRRLFIVIRVYTITALCSSLFFVKSLAHLLFWFDSGKLFKAQFYYY